MGWGGLGWGGVGWGGVGGGGGGGGGRAVSAIQTIRGPQNSEAAKLGDHKTISGRRESGVAVIV